MELGLFVLIALVVGLVAGYFFRGLQKNTPIDHPKTRKELNTMKDEFREYQAQVAEHLNKTAELVSQIEQTYQSIQQHTFTGTQSLNRDSSRSSTLQPRAHIIKTKATTDKPKSPKPPKDYA